MPESGESLNELEQRLEELEDAVEDANDSLADALTAANDMKHSSTLTAAAFHNVEEAHHTLTEIDPTRSYDGE